MSKTMHVNQLAKALTTTPDTVRYYTRIGLLRPRKDERNSYKCYSEEDKARLRFILCARQLDFSVEEIAAILAQTEQDDRLCPAVAELLDRKLEQAQQRLQQTILLKKQLRSALIDCQSGGREPTGKLLHEVITQFAEAELASP